MSSKSMPSGLWLLPYWLDRNVLDIINSPLKVYSG